MQSPRLTPSPSPPRSSGVHWELPSLSNSGSETLACANEFSTSYLSQSSRHPWGVIDYHIYLTHAEKNRDKQHRLRECYLVEQDGINNVILQNNMSLSNVAHNTNPTILFMNLPIPCHNRHSKLILGFDPITQNLLGYLFETDSPIEDYGDLWFNWKRNVGQLVIDLPVERFLEIVQETLTTNIEVLEIGILHHYAATTKALPAGIDMMVVIQLLQFIDDFADMIWVDGSKMREEYGECQKTLRDIVLTGSRQAWFSVRDGTGTSTIEEFRQESLRKVAGAALWYGQSVVDLRDQAAKFGSQFSQPRGKTFNDRLGQIARTQVWDLIVIALILFFLYILGPGLYYLGWPSSLQMPFKQTQHVSLLGWWPFEWDNQQNGLFAWLPFRQHTLSSGLYHLGWSSSLQMPFKQTQQVSLLGWWPFEWDNQQRGLFTWFPFNLTQVLVNWLPFQQHTPSSGWLRWIPFIREVQKMSMFGLMPLKQEIQQPVLLRWISFIGQALKMEAARWWLFKQQAQIVVKFEWLSFNRLVREINVFGKGDFFHCLLALVSCEIYSLACWLVFLLLDFPFSLNVTGL
jgi:hypothetical protein